MVQGPNLITRALESRESSVAGSSRDAAKGKVGDILGLGGIYEPLLALKYRDPLMAQRPDGGLWEVRATSS